MTTAALITNTNLHEIATEGERIYERIKHRYLPKEKGKFLAIDVGSRKVYLGTTSLESIDLAKKDHPNNIFFVVKIGFSAAETLANWLSR